jgi:ectoine hydroxylase-related dioxygenase (phytanoyl-CoA dioxygenase family)
MQAEHSKPVGGDLQEQAEFFRREGYAVARGLFNPAEVGEIREIFAKIHAEGVPGSYERETVQDAVANPDDPLFKYPRVMQPHRFNDRVRDFLVAGKVAARLRAFFGEEPAAAQSMFFFKPPGARGQALHQDQFYLMVEPGTCVAAWTAIDDCDAENGAMMIVPKTNEAPVVCPETADQTQSYTNHLVPVPKGLKAQLVPMKAGDTLFFNGSIIHGSGPNRSKTRFRRSLIGHYVPATTRKISRFYLPLLTMEGSEFQTTAQTAGGPCGSGWNGARH